MVNELIHILAYIVAIVLFIIFGKYIIPCIKKLYPYLKALCDRLELDKACKFAEIAVNAAEQLAKAGIIDINDRKDYAMGILEEEGINLPFGKLSNIVESYVIKLPKFSTAKESTKCNSESLDDEDIK